MITAPPFVNADGRSEWAVSVLAIVTLSLVDSALGDDATPLNSFDLVAPPGMEQQGLGHGA